MTNVGSMGSRDVFYGMMFISKDFWDQRYEKEGKEVGKRRSQS